MKDYYKILEIDPSATYEQIKTQHRLLLHAWHPDKFPDGDLKKKAHERVLDINEAYNVLGDQNKRKSYDQQYRGSFQSRNFSNSSHRNKHEKGSGSQAYSSPKKEHTSDQQIKTSPPKGKANSKIGGLVFSFIVVACIIYLYDLLPISAKKQFIQQEVIVSPVNTAASTRAVPSFTPDPLKELRKRCVFWSDVNSSLLGKIMCVFGEVVTFTPREEVRVPEIGSEWIWYYYFSLDNKEFALYHPSVDREFPEAYTGCIEVTGELKSSKTQQLYIEVWSGSSKNWNLLKYC